jgi:MraZ protein
MEQQYLNPLSPMGADSRRIRRRLFGTSEETELDSAGRVRLPKHLIRHGRLEGSCLVVGVGDHLEIWNNADWQAEAEQFEAEAEDLTERLADKYGGPAPEAAN